MRSVLVVDDHDGFRTVARALLEAEGFNVVGEAAGGATGLSAAARARPTVVLLDIQLPDMDGFAVAERLTYLDPEPAVVLISSRSRATYGTRVATSPARGFIAKHELSGEALREVLGCA